MKLAELRAIAAESLTHPHYQHRDKTETEIRALAKKSFSRLTDAQQTMVYESWLKALKATGEEKTKENEFQFIHLRFLAQTNLFFLCNLLEQYRQATLHTHEDICNDFFVQKNPTMNFEAFAHQYTDLKDRMLLVPRGGFKSSIDIADSIQWVICYPEVTILILTGVYQLASDFVGELRRHFLMDETGALDAQGRMIWGPRVIMDKRTGEWSSSMFQILFPEHCVNANEGKAFEFQTPAGGDSREPTVRAASIEQALSGMHFGVLKLDDVVNNENSLTSDRLEKVNKQISVNRAMLHPHGFMDVIGTWYDEQDYYGKSIKQEEQFAAEEGLLHNIHGSVDSGKFNSSVYQKVYLRAAWWPNEAAVRAGKIESELTKTDYDLWFPERLTYEFLVKERKKDKDGFSIKYLNNPRQIHRVRFSRELLLRRTIPHSELPPDGTVVTCVDTAYSIKSWADYTVILTAIISGGRFYILNMVRGKFNEYELPAIIANTAHKWKPKRIAIEDSIGVKWMGRELIREMDRLQIKIPVEYVSIGMGSKARSKQLKAKPVVRLFGDERLFLSSTCEGISEIYDELEKFTGTGNDAHDDIVSALSLLAEVFSTYADIDKKINQPGKIPYQDRLSQERHDLIYGMGKYANLMQQDDNPKTAFQMQSLATVDVSGDVDPFAELF